MKTICIVIKDLKLIQRYLLRSGLFSFLLQRVDIRIILLVQKSSEDIYRKEFGQDRVEIVGIPAIKSSLWYRLVVAFSRITYYDRRFTKYFRYKRSRGILSPAKMYFKIFFVHMLSRMRPVAYFLQGVLHWAAVRTKVPSPLSVFFDTYRPDLVVSTSLLEVSFDIPVLIGARSRGIKTAGTFRLWSGLGTSPFLLFHPDYFILHDEFQKEMAVTWHAVPPERIRVIGIPYFDWYKKNGFILPRDEFIRSLGIDPAKRLILYAGDASLFPERKIAFAKILDRWIQKRQISENMFVVFRLHPYHANAKKDFEIAKSIKFSSVLVDIIEKTSNIKIIEDSEEDYRFHQHFMNLVAHSDLVITPGGGILLEAAAFGKPVIALAFDGGVSVPYWFSYARYYDGSLPDLAEIIHTGGIHPVYSSSELLRSIHEYIENPTTDKEGRRRLLRRFIEPFDGKATERFAEAFLSLLG